MKTLKWILVCVVLLGLGIAGAGYQIQKQVYQPIKLSEPRLYQISKGQSALGVVDQLHKQGLLTHSFGLKLAIKLDPQLAQLKVGTYELLPNMSAKEVLLLFSSGKEKQFSISLVEGLTWQDWLAVLKAHPQIEMTQTFTEQLLQLAEDLPRNSIEGFLMPDTYHFVANTAAIDIVKRAHASMRQYLQQAWQNRAFDLPYDSAYQGLIMASIIEKETGVAHERPRIAGVFVNRLRLNMRLQTDPTVIYGMGDAFDGDIRRKDLTTATPYNTYVIKGLPPTPIAMPSKLAIDAAFNPLETDELYFVAKGDGSHQFSTNLKAHNQAVRKYQLKK
ncbi:endolytic transglycosylase MltG [Paraglaciecola aestuariivivens]